MTSGMQIENIRQPPPIQRATVAIKPGRSYKVHPLMVRGVERAVHQPFTVSNNIATIHNKDSEELKIDQSIDQDQEKGQVLRQLPMSQQPDAHMTDEMMALAVPEVSNQNIMMQEEEGF